MYLAGSWYIGRDLDPFLFLQFRLGKFYMNNNKVNQVTRIPHFPLHVLCPLCCIFSLKTWRSHLIQFQQEKWWAVMQSTLWSALRAPDCKMNSMSENSLRMRQPLSQEYRFQSKHAILFCKTPLPPCCIMKTMLPN